MLVLTRRTNETLVIGENGLIRVTLIGIKGNQVKIGVDAPKSVPVHREEVYRRILADSEKALKAANEAEIIPPETA